MDFVEGRRYTRDQIQARFGGSKQAYLRSRTRTANTTSSPQAPPGQASSSGKSVRSNSSSGPSGPSATLTRSFVPGSRDS